MSGTTCLTRASSSPMECLTNSRRSRSVYGSGPASSNTLPSCWSWKTHARIASATLSTYTGWILLEPDPTSGATPKSLIHLAARLMKRSSSPNMMLGRRMVASGYTSRTTASPCALRRSQSEGESSSASIADTWISFGTPASLHALAMLPTTSTLAPKRSKLRVSSCLPTRLITTSECRTASMMVFGSRGRKFTGMICPRSPITLRCLVLSSSPRYGTMTCVPTLPSLFTT
mmetsp:Transcript_52027/g.108663  ORF Transcript_52027/g.108663 Transcript_52027/m.108663 type:complete len:231 (-) Transcript_52027:199-891(-)